MNLEDLFTPAFLTEAINALPTPPSTLGSSGIFEVKPVNTTFAVIESINGKLVLVENTDRNADPKTKGNSKRTRRVFEIPHLPKNGVILPSELQVQGFGQDGVQVNEQSKVINDKLEDLKADIETTIEFHRVGAISGIILDADGTTVIENLFTAFGVQPKSINIPFSTAATDVGAKILEGKRHAQKKLGGAVITGWKCYCSPTYFDALTSHPNVEKAYANYQDAADRLGGDNRKGFVYKGVEFIEYDVEVATASGGTVKFIEDGKARLVPIAKKLFKTFYAPANYNEAVGTNGLPMYAKAEPRKMGKGWDLEAQSNPLSICTEPSALVTFSAT